MLVEAEREFGERYVVTGEHRGVHGFATDYNDRMARIPQTLNLRDLRTAIDSTPLINERLSRRSEARCWLGRRRHEAQ